MRSASQRQCECGFDRAAVGPGVVHNAATHTLYSARAYRRLVGGRTFNPETDLAPDPTSAGLVWKDGVWITPEELATTVSAGLKEAA